MNAAASLTAAATTPASAQRRPGIFARLFPRISRHPLMQAIAHYLNRGKRAPKIASHRLSGAAKTRIVKTRDGVALTVREYGAPTARHTVVLLHGLCMNQDAWNMQVAQLISQWGDDVRIISYDHRGHGDSADAPIHTYRVDHLADDLAGLLVALHVTGPVTLVGHSLGGMTALAYLGRPAHLRPVQPHSVVLVATAAGKLTERGVPRLLKTRVSDITCAVGHRYPWLTHAVVRLLGRPVSQLLKIWAEPSLGGALHSTPVPTKLGFLQGLKVYDHYATLPTITAQTTIISGGADRLTPAAHSQDMAAGIRGARLIHRPAAGHVVIHEEPQVVSDAINGHIADARRASAAVHRKVDVRRYDYASLVTEALPSVRRICTTPEITRPLRERRSANPEITHPLREHRSANPEITRPLREHRSLSPAPRRNELVTAASVIRRNPQGPERREREGRRAA